MVTMVTCEREDCSQPSTFSYFYWIVERLNRIARELDASTEDLTGWVVGGSRKIKFLLARFANNPRSLTPFARLKQVTNRVSNIWSGHK